MKKTFRKLAAAVLTGVLALSLAGCGGDSKEQKSAGKGEYANLKEVVLIGADTAGKGSAGQQFAFNDYLKFIGVDKIKEYGKKYLKGPQYDGLF